MDERYVRTAGSLLWFFKDAAERREELETRERRLQISIKFSREDEEYRR
jgi:hypothetical protein